MIIFLKIFFISQLLAIGDCILIYFYSTNSPFDPIVVDPMSNISLNLKIRKFQEKFGDKSCANYLIIHGFASSGQDNWVIEMKDRLLFTSLCVQVLALDWSENSSWQFDLNIGYVRSIQNIARTSELFGEYFKKFLQLKNSSIFFNNLHCIGHSLGAHMCGFISKYIKLNYGIVFKRISGLDPAGPCFENLRPENRLSTQDAHYVDVIHTSLNLGIQIPIGHSDYYVNDAKTQPGCLRTNEIKLPVFMCKEPTKKNSMNRMLFNLFDLVKCSHSKAHQYFIDSILSKCAKFDAFKCDNYKSFTHRKCFHCHTNKMGFHSDPESNDGINRIYFLDYANPNHEITEIDHNLSPNVCESVRIKYFDNTVNNQSFYLNKNNLKFLKEFRRYCNEKKCRLKFLIEGYKSKKRSYEWIESLIPNEANGTNIILMDWSDIQNIYDSKDKSVVYFRSFLLKFVKNMGQYFSKNLIDFDCVGSDETAKLMCKILKRFLEENLPHAITDHYLNYDVYCNKASSFLLVNFLIYFNIFLFILNTYFFH